MLTEREKDLLFYIIEFKKINGYPPTVREMMQGINTGSTQHVSDMLCKLKEEGYIHFKQNCSRTITVIKFKPSE